MSKRNWFGFQSQRKRSRSPSVSQPDDEFDDVEDLLSATGVDVPSFTGEPMSSPAVFDGTGKQLTRQEQLQQLQFLLGSQFRSDNRYQPYDPAPNQTVASLSASQLPGNITDQQRNNAGPMPHIVTPAPVVHHDIFTPHEFMSASGTPGGLPMRSQVMSPNPVQHVPQYNTPSDMQTRQAFVQYQYSGIGVGPATYPDISAPTQGGVNAPVRAAHAGGTAQTPGGVSATVQGATFTPIYI